VLPHSQVITDYAHHWIKCRSCGELLWLKRFDRVLRVCTHCGNHGPTTPAERIRHLVDPGSFRRMPVPAVPVDPLSFVDTKPYRDRLADATARTQEEDAVVIGTAEIRGRSAVIAVMNFGFLGGSMGSAVGEALAVAGEAALASRRPLILVTASGGARMQEGCLSLLQMAKVAEVMGRLHEAGVLTVAVVTDPTFGGVAASFATQADVLVAEPAARLGFAGPRVIEQTIGQKLPRGFQTAEFLSERGLVDIVAPRQQLPAILERLMAAADGSPQPAGSRPDAGTRGVVTTPIPVTEQADAWQAVQLARHPDRPTARDYLHLAFDWFVELRGDRCGTDSPTLVGGIASIGHHPVMVLGTQKGHSTKELVDSNFGMVGPEGYRKAQRLMRLAERLRLPVVTLVDTPGAYPATDAEEHGQAHAIAESILQMTALRVPTVAVVTGEGGSGGALALAVADRLLVLENATYSVISPEGCAAILWKSATQAPDAARALKLMSWDLLRSGVADGVVCEPAGGAQADQVGVAASLRAALLDALAQVTADPAGDVLAARRRRLRQVGTAPSGVAR
jgi:acetyl-CoA carboxylase carboxyl transferase subunit beta